MVWVIGDIHGKKELLEKLLKEIGDKEDIYCVGDVIDRGSGSLDCIDICIEKDIKVVKGNHEDMAIDYFFNQGRYSEGIWYSNGGLVTFNQIHELTKQDAKEQIKKYLDWMMSLPMYYVLGDEFLICHAGVCDDIEKACKGAQPEILWRRMKIRHPKYFQIVGHSVQRKGPLVVEHEKYKYANIDTGGCFTGRLSAIHLPDKKTITVSSYE